jgi:hypothetical protein
MHRVRYSPHSVVDLLTQTFTLSGPSTQDSISISTYFDVDVLRTNPLHAALRSQDLLRFDSSWRLLLMLYHAARRASSLNINVLYPCRSPARTIDSVIIQAFPTLGEELGKRFLAAVQGLSRRRRSGSPRCARPNCCDTHTRSHPLTLSRPSVK